MSRRPYTLSQIDIMDMSGEKQYVQLPHVLTKNYAAYDAHSDKHVTGDGEIVFFGDTNFNEMNREQYLTIKVHDVFNNILFPGMYRRK